MTPKIRTFLLRPRRQSNWHWNRSDQQRCRHNDRVNARRSALQWRDGAAPAGRCQAAAAQAVAESVPGTNARDALPVVPCYLTALRLSRHDTTTAKTNDSADKILKTTIVCSAGHEK